MNSTAPPLQFHSSIHNRGPFVNSERRGIPNIFLLAKNIFALSICQQQIDHLAVALHARGLLVVF